MKNLLILLSCISFKVIAVVPTQIMSDVPGVTNNKAAKADGLTTVSGLMDSLAKAQSVEQQLTALQNLSNFQKSPGTAVQQANDAVTGLLNNFNGLNNSHLSDLTALINSLAGSSTAEGMNIKLMSAANMQLTAIQGTLQQIQAQQQAMIAYKQAEVAEQQAAKAQTQQNSQATFNKLKSY
jgi:hypothetical protein